MKRIIAALFLAASLSAFAESEYVTTEITSKDRAMPTFYESLKNKMAFSLGWKDGSNPKKWKKAGLAKARELMIQYEDKTPFDMKVLEEEKRDGYTAQKIAFNISEESRVSAYLLIPDNAKSAPAALMLHAHGSEFRIGKEQMVRPINAIDFEDLPDDATEEQTRESKKLNVALSWASKYYDDDDHEAVFPGDELAKRGYVVLATDALGWGDRSVEGFKTDSQQALASNLFNMGSSFAGIIAQEDCRAAKFLASLKQVDKKRVAAVGFSMGAFRAWQVAALSDDITAGIAQSWFGTMKGLMVIGNNQLKGQSAFAMLHPYIARYLDYPDVAGLAAPKSMLFYNGSEDPLFPVECVNEGYGKMHKIWTANKADSKLHTEIIDGMGHEFRYAQQKSAFDWLDAQFK
nr:dienelactone hydrolase family protein [Treponema sp.]